MARSGREHQIPKFSLIKKIGGKLESDYYSLRMAVDEMNGEYSLGLGKENKVRI